MVSDKDFRVRKSIVSSLSEICNILGPQITETDLVPVLNKFSKDEGEIQNTLLKTLPKLLRNLDINSRRGYLDRLKKLLNPREKWRTRMEYSNIIGEYYNVFDEEITYKQIFPISLSFCFDDVAEVRFTAAKHCSNIITQLLSKESEYKEKCLKIIELFALSINYHYRQL
jgi:hypothetical protein